MQRMTTAALLLGTMAALAACSGRDSGMQYDGVQFSGKAKPVSKQDRASFVATAKPASASLDGAIAAAAFQGTRYCIGYLGTSDIAWLVGPETPKDQIAIDGDTVSLQGTCVE